MADSKPGGPGDAMSPFSGARADLGGRAQATDTIIIVAAIIVGLSFGRDVLVPIAIAVLLSFVLAPVTDALTRLRIGRVASVLLAVTLAFALLIGLGAVIGKQVAQLGENLPQWAASSLPVAGAARWSTPGHSRLSLRAMSRASSQA